jgi:hypothetical protein
MLKSARFWVDHKGSYVKLTIKKDQELNTTEGGLTDEGYDYTNTSYTFDGKEVECVSVRDAKDCDGRASWSWEAFFDATNYQTRSAFVGWTEDGEEIRDQSIQLPQWEKLSSSQRDVYAEMMGY